MNKNFVLQNTVNNEIITIIRGKVPVIKIEATNLNNYGYANSIVNFLRGGCPKVQILILNSEKLDYSRDISNYLYLLKRDYIEPLQLPNEKFSYETLMPVVTYSSE